MQHASACRHINLTACPDVSKTVPVTDTSLHHTAAAGSEVGPAHGTAARGCPSRAANAPVVLAGTLVPAPEQEVTRTRSRRSGPRRWLASVEWLVGAGLHPRASQTTLTVAADLAQRMDFDTGHVRYGLDAMVSRLGVSRATITRHVSYLRQMGSLAWVEHGSRTNIRAALRLGGYAGTATVYAAVIPPVYDRALGHRLVGTGYTARVIVDLRHQPKPVDNPAVDNPGTCPPETPSLTLVKKESQVKVEIGKGSSTAQARPAEHPPRRRKKRRLTILGHRITAPRIERARRMAVSVRPLVNWIQGATHNELSWVLLDLIAKDWSRPQIARWLHQLGQELGVRGWRPRSPHRVIAAALLRQDQAETRSADAYGPDYDEALRHSASPNDEFQQACQTVKDVPSRSCGEEYPSLEEVPEDAWDLTELRQAAASDRTHVLTYARLCGESEAVRVYGTAAVAALENALEMARAGFRAPST
ncbi:hypothetical protein ABT390_35505 [Streptomyces aurantiacus]|nr:hypothetical protein [Streptomyces aurantiacus]